MGRSKSLLAVLQCHFEQGPLPVLVHRFSIGLVLPILLMCISADPLSLVVFPARALRSSTSTGSFIGCRSTSWAFHPFEINTALKSSMRKTVRRYGSPLSKEELISRHERAKAVSDTPGRKWAPLMGGSTGMTWGGMADEHGMEVHVDFSRLRPISIASLDTAGNSKGRYFTGHQGRFLAGTLIVEALQATAVVTLLEDDDGDVVRLFVYRASAEQLPKGSRIMIAMPFYKIMADGLPGVRCDSPGSCISFVMG
eukprot:TRINITY_DN126477_c0_g1_i1.p1 TRINITY_DN126477_c0_g1~~TRINITY_DN126477_c0_g1_i1.p1  ORF type:complete len:254 (+),score=8.72 TRINITY_DN126477_c0_g1_i1:89-850(+)